MRTTLTLDDDVAAALLRLRQARGGRLKPLINALLRESLLRQHMRPEPREHFQTQSVDLGRLRTGSIDNVAEALAVAEGEPFR